MAEEGVFCWLEGVRGGEMAALSLLAIREWNPLFSKRNQVSAVPWLKKLGHDDIFMARFVYVPVYRSLVWANYMALTSPIFCKEKKFWSLADGYQALDLKRF